MHYSFLEAVVQLRLTVSRKEKNMEQLIKELLESINKQGDGVATDQVSHVVKVVRDQYDICAQDGGSPPVLRMIAFDQNN